MRGGWMGVSGVTYDDGGWNTMRRKKMGVWLHELCTVAVAEGIIMLDRRPLPVCCGRGGRPDLRHAYLFVFLFAGSFGQGAS